MGRSVRRIYLDASCIIYMVEALPGLTSPTTRRVVEHLGQPENRLLTSRLSRLECRIHPLREKDASRLAEYEDLRHKLAALGPGCVSAHVWSNNVAATQLLYLRLLSDGKKDKMVK